MSGTDMTNSARFESTRFRPTRPEEENGSGWISTASRPSPHPDRFATRAIPEQGYSWMKSRLAFART
jgi:hypothetical protein